jgi:hypothetical protein
VTEPFSSRHAHWHLPYQLAADGQSGESGYPAGGSDLPHDRGFAAVATATLIPIVSDAPVIASATSRPETPGIPNGYRELAFSAVPGLQKSHSGVAVTVAPQGCATETEEASRNLCVCFVEGGRRPRGICCDFVLEVESVSQIGFVFGLVEYGGASETALASGNSFDRGLDELRGDLQISSPAVRLVVEAENESTSILSSTWTWTALVRRSDYNCGSDSDSNLDSDYGYDWEYMIVPLSGVVVCVRRIVLAPVRLFAGSENATEMSTRSPCRMSSSTRNRSRNHPPVGPAGPVPACWPKMFAFPR